MLRPTLRVLTAMVATAVVWQCAAVNSDHAYGAHGWYGKRRISYQQQKDLFYNYYVGPYDGNAAAQMYVAPQPVPANVGHTYVTYQPLMPHEYMYRHQRGYYTYNSGAGWTRTNVRYGTKHNFLQDYFWRLHYPVTSQQIRSLNDFTFFDRYGR